MSEVISEMVFNTLRRQFSMIPEEAVKELALSLQRLIKLPKPDAREEEFLTPKQADRTIGRLAR